MKTYAVNSYQRIAKYVQNVDRGSLANFGLIFLNWVCYLLFFFLT